jgi:outer membrane lipoprotein carrier protein|nr:MAG: hypothetical protein KatS3mg041_0212 [Bacteroidota bacterium]
MNLILGLPLISSALCSGLLALYLLLQTDAEARLAELMRRWESFEAISGRFEQRLASPTGEISRMVGRFWIAGDRFRIESGGQELISDGRTLWIYNPEQKRALRMAYEPGAEPEWSPPALWRGRWRERFRVRSLSEKTLPDGRRAVCFALEARNPGLTPQQLLLCVEQKSGLPAQLELSDPGQSEPVRIRIWDVRINPPLRPDRFRFTPPPGTQVVDMRGG